MPLKRLALACILFTTALCASAGQGAEYVHTYFDLWLKDHKFTDYAKRGDGIFFPAKGVLLDGDVHEAKRLQPGVFSVESRISVTFKDGRRLEDFVAGVGDQADKAFLDSLQNFCLTTLHPIYAELFNHADPHVRKAQWLVGGEKRRVFLSSWGQRGTPVDEAFQRQVETTIAQVLAGTQLSREIHWVKLVVLVHDKQLKQLVVTIDGMRSEALESRLAKLPWPAPKEFSMAKLFFVVGEL